MFYLIFFIQRLPIDVELFGTPSEFEDVEVILSFVGNDVQLSKVLITIITDICQSKATGVIFRVLLFGYNDWLWMELYAERFPSLW